MNISKHISFCVMISCSLLSLASFPTKATLKQPSEKQLTIIADKDFLHDHDSKCLLKVNPIGTVVTSNDMDDRGNIILDEKQDRVVIRVPKPKDGILHLDINFECNCFTTHHTISYAQLSDHNSINLYDDSSTMTTTLSGTNKHKTACSKNKQRIGRASEHTRPGAVVEPAMPERMTVGDILHNFHETKHILQILKKEGYTLQNITKQDLELPGKLSDAQIEYIMQRLPQ